MSKSSCAAIRNLRKEIADNPARFNIGDAVCLEDRTPGVVIGSIYSDDPDGNWYWVYTVQPFGDDGGMTDQEEALEKHLELLAKPTEEPVAL